MQTDAASKMGLTPEKVSDADSSTGYASDGEYSVDDATSPSGSWVRASNSSMPAARKAALCADGVENHTTTEAP